MFKVELEFKKDVPANIFNIVKKIFIDEGMTCFLDENGKQIFTDSEDTGFMNIGASLIRSYEEIPNISTMLNSALWFHNKKCENLMETFYYEEK